MKGKKWSNQSIDERMRKKWSSFLSAHNVATIERLDEMKYSINSAVGDI